MQLGQADGLARRCPRLLGDRPPRCLVVVVGDMADRGGEGDHRPVASVAHDRRRTSRSPAAAPRPWRDRRARPPPPSRRWRGRGGSARWCPAPGSTVRRPPTNADGSPASQRACAGIVRTYGLGESSSGSATTTASSARPAMPSMLTCRRVSNSVINAGIPCRTAGRRRLPRHRRRRRGARPRRPSSSRRGSAASAGRRRPTSARAAGRWTAGAARRLGCGRRRRPSPRATAAPWWSPTD